jgi:hypothetical protein
MHLVFILPENVTDAVAFDPTARVEYKEDLAFQLRLAGLCARHEADSCVCGRCRSKAESMTAADRRNARGRTMKLHAVSQIATQPNMSARYAITHGVTPPNQPHPMAGAKRQIVYAWLCVRYRAHLLTAAQGSRRCA